MTEKNVTTLPLKRVLISLLLFFLAAITWRAFDLLLHEIYISKMISINIFGSLLMIYNWSLIELHHNRIKNNNDKYLFFVLNVLFIAAVTYFGKVFLNAEILLPPRIILVSYGYARIGMLIGFSFIKAFLINISFKCLTDNLDIKHKELQVILVSSLVFGLLFTLGFTELSISSLFRTYLYNVLIVGFSSYSYNQTTSILPATIALAVVHFLLMFASTL